MRRYVPFIILFFLAALAYAIGLHEYATLEFLKSHRTSLKTLTVDNPVAAPLLYILIYTLLAALSIPGGAVLSILGGFLFPQPLCTLYVVLGATTGATILFLTAKTAIGDRLKKRATPLLQKMHSEFQKDAANYLLFLRLVPAFPFWLVNLASALFGVTLFTFVWTTFLGIIPGAFVFTQAGNGLGAILDTGESLSLEAVFNLQVRIALVALGLFALLPVLLKRIRHRL